MIKTDIVVNNKDAYLEICNSHSDYDPRLHFCDKDGNHLDPYNFIYFDNRGLYFASGIGWSVETNHGRLFIDGVDII